MKLYDSIGPNPYVVRFFILERGGLELDIQPIDIMAMENRRLAYRTRVNPRGELPALRIDEHTVLTEITAVCEYLDEIAKGGKSLFGETPLERAQTRMWLRRMDLEIAQPAISWYRNSPDTIDVYKGHRIPCPEARVVQKVQISQFLNLLDDELEGKSFLCGERFSAADIHICGIINDMVDRCSIGPWMKDPARKNVIAYLERVGGRQAARDAEVPFKSKVSV